MKRHIVLLIFLLLTSSVGSVFSQNDHANALEKKIQKLKGVAKAEAYAELITTYGNNNPDKGIKLGNAALQYTRDINNPINQGKILNAIGKCYGNKGNYEQERNYHQQALRVFDSIGDKRNIAITHSYLGMTYWNFGQYDKSIDHLLIGLKIREGLKDKRDLLASYNNLGIVYQNLQNPQLALNYYLKSLDVIEQTNMKKQLGPVLNNIGSLYSVLKDYQKALIYLKRAQKIHEETNNMEGLKNTYLNLATNYSTMGDLHNALTYFKKSLALNQKTDDKRGVAITALNLSDVYVKLKNYAEAGKYLTLCQKISREIHVKDVLMNSLYSFAGLYEKQGRYPKAMECIREYIAIKDSIYSEQSNRNIAELQVKYENEKKARENLMLTRQIEVKDLQLKRRQTLAFSFIGGSVLLLIILLLIWNAYRIKNQSLRKEKEVNRVKSRFVSTVSHEFRTPLAGIYSSAQLLQNYGNKLEPLERNDLFIKIYDSIHNLKNMLDEFSFLEKGQSNKLSFQPSPVEFELLCRQMLRDTMAFYGNEREIVNHINSQAGKVLMDKNLLQHIVTNLLSNALKYSDNSSPVEFETTMTDADHLSIRIADKGIGIPEEDIKYIFNDFHRGINVGSIQGTGLGMTIVKNCVDLHGGTLSIQSKVGQGTEVVVNLPFQTIITNPEP